MTTTIQYDDAARTIQVRAETANDELRTVSATISSESVVPIYDPRSGSIIDEILLADGADLPRQAPLLNNHVRNIDCVVGSARRIRIDGKTVVADLHFAGDPESLRVWRKVRDGHLTDVSCGYCVDACVDIQPGRSASIDGRQFHAEKTALRVVKKWRLREISIVPIGADPAAKTRSNITILENRNMITSISEPADKLRDAIGPVIQRGGQSVRWADLGKACLQHLGELVPRGEPDIIRAMTANATISDTIDALLGAAMIGGFNAEPDTTEAITRAMPAENFKTSEVYTLATGSRIRPHVRRSEAESTDVNEYEFGKSNYQIARYSSKLVVDEQDMIDGKPVGAIMFAIEQEGATAGRLRPDLVYSLILQNLAMQYDGINLFHADHGNFGTPALGSAGLAAGLASIGNQVLTDPEGDPIHLNNQGRIVIAPPDLVESARRAVRDINLGNGQDIKVVQESRLSTIGLVDPTDDETIHVGSATNWLLAATAAVLPSIVVLGLDGNLEPTISRSPTGDGRWGWCWDIKLDIGVVAIDHRAVYWSDGTG